MKRNYRYFALLFILLGVFLNDKANSSIRIHVRGDWNLRIDSFDLVGGELVNTYESPPGQLFMGVSGIPWLGDFWRVTVKRIDINWDNNLRLFVRRTSSGFGHPQGRIAGGASYREITDTDRTFIWGEGLRFFITAQLKLTGVTLKTEMDHHVTIVYYTVVEP